MPNKCCVKDCRSNYATGSRYVTVFSFPRELERKQLWLEAINRPDFCPGRFSGVCIKHFEDRFIIRESTAVRDDGSLLVVPRKFPTLSKDAVPTVFGNSQPHKLQDADDDIEMFLTDDTQLDEILEEDRIESFAQFKQSVLENPPRNWIFAFSETAVMLLKLDLDECPKVCMSVKFFADQTVEVWKNNTTVSPDLYVNLFGRSKKCDTYTKYDLLINLLEAQAYESPSNLEKMDAACRLLRECLPSKPKTLDDSTILFLCEQLEVLITKKNILL